MLDAHHPPALADPFRVGIGLRTESVNPTAQNPGEYGGAHRVALGAMTDQPSNPDVAAAEEDSLPEQMRVRREKRQRLVESGTAAYPTTLERTHTLTQIREKYDA